MTFADSLPPRAANDPPWGACGDPRDESFGSVFTWPGAGRAVALTYDRRGRRHAVTLFEPEQLGAEIVLQGRRFTVTPGRASEARL